MRTPTIYVKHRGLGIYCRTAIHPGDKMEQLYYAIVGWIGMWNSEQAARDYIDFRLGTQPTSPAPEPKP